MYREIKGSRSQEGAADKALNVVVGSVGSVEACTRVQKTFESVSEVLLYAIEVMS